jgi:hypothetical protein
MRELGAKWKGVLKVCPELAELEQAIQGWLSRQAGAERPTQCCGSRS